MDLSRLMACSGLLLLVAGCGQAPTPPAAPQGAGLGEPVAAGVVVIRESFLATTGVEDDVDSVAVAAAEGWAIATTKGTHQLLVLDASSGLLVRRVGEPGPGPGQLQRPNGIAVAGGLVLVVERDNARVQAFSLPGIASVGTFGDGLLERPYGLAVIEGEGALEVFVTDNFELSPEELVAGSRLAGRVKHFRVIYDGATFSAEPVATFGDTSGEGALYKVETIAVDPVAGLLLVAEEEESRMGLRAYRTDGAFTGQVVGRELFTAEPEGVALWRCGDDGYWVVTDQHATRTVFHVLDRRTFAVLGSFIGEATANTDGIGLSQASLPELPAGALYAVHDDHGVAAFDWRELAAAFGLTVECDDGSGPEPR